MSAEETVSPGIELGLSRDPDLEALPEPRRPGRRLTLVTMSVTLVLSLVMAFALRGQAAYALASGSPDDVGYLTDVQLSPALANHYVRGEALLASDSAVRYSRPLENDSYRLAHVAGNERIWVEVRVPDGLEGPHFVPPSSFVGRLVPIEQSGLSHNDLDRAVTASGGTMPKDAWLLMDGHAPQGSRWAIGLILLFIAFAGFNAFGLYRLWRPAKDVG